MFLIGLGAGRQAASPHLLAGDHDERNYCYRLFVNSPARVISRFEGYLLGNNFSPQDV